MQLHAGEGAGINTVSSKYRSAFAVAMFGAVLEFRQYRNGLDSATARLYPNSAKIEVGKVFFALVAFYLLPC